MPRQAARQARNGKVVVSDHHHIRSTSLDDVYSQLEHTTKETSKRLNQETTNRVFSSSRYASLSCTLPQYAVQQPTRLITTSCREQIRPVTTLPPVCARHSYVCYVSPMPMSTPLPFPSSASGKDVDGMRIDIPKTKEEQTATTSGHRKPNAMTGGHDGGNAAAATATTPGAQPNGPSVPTRGSSNANGPAHTWHHHPRQPPATADSYFPNSGASSSASSTTGPAAGNAQPPRTPGSMRNHSRQPSITSLTPSTGANVTGPPPSARKSGGGAGGHNMSLSLSTGAHSAHAATTGNNAADSFADFVGANGAHAGPPSPSTLTDIILTLHSTLYGGKRTAEEVNEMVWRFYDRDAVFESPLLAASGREQIANQFIMAFTLPGMDVKSELRDVICSDFEFDGTRAGIIDQTISVTFLPSLFGKDQASTPSYGYAQSHAQTGFGHDRGGSATPAYTLQSAITPHPFASYSQINTPAAGSTFSRYATNSQNHSPTTPYSMWGNSRPHTPGTSSHIRPLSHSFRPSTPPSVNGDDDDDTTGHSHSTIQAHDETHYMTINEAGGGQVSRPAMPQDALTPHWSAQGLGRSSLRAFLWGVFHPRAVLKHMCTIHLRLMSRLEFNDAGLIVRHEDTWGVRETIEGTIPFASVIYALERRIVGYICSFAVGRGFRISNALARHAIGPGVEKSQWSIDRQERDHGDANEAAHALLLGYDRHEKIQSMARSRASSPTRNRFGMFGPSHTISAGGSSTAGYSSRSRARSLFGGPHSAAPTRTTSSDNLLNIGYGAAYGERERHNTHGGETLPPDSSARYRTGTRRITTSTASAPINSSGGGSWDGPWQQADIYGASIDGGGDANKTRAPDRDGH